MPAMVAAATQRSASNAAVASACGPPPDQPAVTNRLAPIWSSTRATSAAASATRRAGCAPEFPYPGLA